jgi:rSAM/selenodomain-associated transferase 1
MAESKSENRLIVFAKAPIAGEVKTRLTPFLTAESAAQLHKNLVEHTLVTVTSIENCSVELWVGSDHLWWGELAKRFAVEVFQQCGNDLGERMLFALDDALQRSHKVLIVGTDCPSITPQYLADAFECLDRESVVIGPADDGGYVMLGLRRSVPLLFTNMEWGSANVFPETVSRLETAGLGWCELESLMDIDRPDDFLTLSQLKPELVKGVMA